MRIGLLTAFSALVEHYSLTRVVLDQAKMIAHAGHTPVLICLDDFDTTKEVPSYLEILPCIPTFQKIDYARVSDLTEAHKELVGQMADALLMHCNGMQAIFTHDILFTGWNLPMNLAVHRVAGSMFPFWMHWIHSVPMGGRDYWRLPPNGKLVYPNATDRVLCAEQFQVHSEEVLTIPHSLDARNFLFTTERAKELVTRFSLYAADIVMTYPVPTDRMEHKGIDQVIQVLAKIKQEGGTVKLIVCNAWCTNDELRVKVRRTKALAASLNLNEQEVIFTSEVWPDLAVGVPNEVIRDLMLYSNLFICPTKSETFGLTVAEAALSGQLLVLNANLPMQAELAGPQNAIYFAFGSLRQTPHNKDWDKTYLDMARVIMHRFAYDNALTIKTRYRQRYSMETVWRKIEAALHAFKLGVRVTVNIDTDGALHALNNVTSKVRRVGSGKLTLEKERGILRDGHPIGIHAHDE